MSPSSNEAFVPPKVDQTSLSDICKVFANLHMQWMGIWIHHHCIITVGGSPNLGNQQKSRIPGLLLGYKPYHYAINEDYESQKLDHTSFSDICKVFFNLHMQWMGIWIHHHRIITAGASLYLGNHQKSRVTAGLQILLLCKQLVL